MMTNKLKNILAESRNFRKETDATLHLHGIEYNLEDWLTIKEYTKKYGLSGTNVVSNWIDRGVIPKENYIIISELNNLKLIKNQSYR